MDNPETQATLNTRHRTTLIISRLIKWAIWNPQKNQGWTQVLAKSKRLLFLIRHPENTGEEKFLLIQIMFYFNGIDFIYWKIQNEESVHSSTRGNRGRDRMVVGFTTYLCNQCLSPLKLWVGIPFRRGVLDTTLCDTFVSDIRQVGIFLRVHRFPPPIKLTVTI